MILLTRICSIGVHGFFNCIESVACRRNSSAPNAVFLADYLICKSCDKVLLSHSYMCIGL